jgi:bifunctional non-homologous end joining protein LigD
MEDQANSVTGKGDSVRIGAHKVNITRPSKVLFPKDGITKRELIEYYFKISGKILPYLKARPLTLERYPDGVDTDGFIQQSVPDYYPDWIDVKSVRKVGGRVRHVVCNNRATLVYLANQACVTPHTWLSRIDRLNYPDQMVFDLDPSGEDFGLVKATARSLNRFLSELELPSFVKTTGSRGLHVVVPLKRRDDFDSVREFAKRVSEKIVKERPHERTLELRKKSRRGRVFIDTNRNAYGQTFAPVYAVRARSGAPISAPLQWSELNSKALRPDGVTIRNIFKRLEKIGDPWVDFNKPRVFLTNARKKLDSLE